MRLWLAARNPAVLLALGLALAGVGLWSYVTATVIIPLANTTTAGDFNAYWHAAHALRSGGSPYALLPPVGTGGTVTQTLNAYLYPPFLAAVLVPLTALSLGEATLVWIVLLQALTVGSYLLALDLLRIRSWVGRVLLFDAFILSYVVQENLQVGSINVLLLFTTLLWMTLYTRGSWMSWALVGLNVGTKLLQAPLLILAALRDRKGFGAAAAAGVATVLVGGVTMTIVYLRDVYPRLGVATPTVWTDVSWLAMIERVLHPGSAEYSYDPTFPEAKWLLLAGALLVTVVTLWAVRPLGDRRLTASVFLAASPLYAMDLGVGHLLVILPAALVIATLAQRWGDRVAMAVAAFLVAFNLTVQGVVAELITPYVARVSVSDGAALAAIAMWVIGIRVARQRAHAPQHLANIAQPMHRRQRLVRESARSTSHPTG